MGRWMDFPPFLWFCLFWVEVGHSTRNKLLFVPLPQDKERGKKMEKRFVRSAKQAKPFHCKTVSSPWVVEPTYVSICMYVNSC